MISSRTVFSNLYNANGTLMYRIIKQGKINTNTAVFWIQHRNVVGETFCPNMTRGFDYLKTANLNKGLSFTLAERQTLGIQGLIAGSVKTMKQQLEICTFSVDRYKDPLNKYLYLTELQDNNEKLFYNLLATDVEKYLPLVYTPTVGTACQRFGLVYRRPRGLFITIHDKGRVAKILRNWYHVEIAYAVVERLASMVVLRLTAQGGDDLRPEPNVRAIVVTDGERILGLGDLGAYGMGIPVGKLTLYTALAGVPPTNCLPVTLDVGTNNPLLLEDPMYIGLRMKRVRGKEYDEFIDEFMQACVKRYSHNILIQFEDFALINATRLLAKYQSYFCTFNDDIQGTAGVIVAGIFSAVRITKKPIDQNIFLFLGAGSAGIGIANLICDAMVEVGVKLEDAREKIFLFDVDGLLTSKRPNGVPKHAAHYSKNLEPTKDFGKFVETSKATCLVGVSTAPGSFTPAILKQMAKNTERPLIFALSNPTIKAECTAQEAYDNTEGRCIFASGSPFPPVKFGGKEYRTGQGNNSYIFPGVALGVLACFAHHVPDIMFLTAAKSLAKNVKQEDLDIGRLYPPINDIKRLSYKIAEDVIEEAYKLKLASIYPKPKDIPAFVQEIVYDSEYSNFVTDLYKYPEETGKVMTIPEMIAAYTAKKKK